MYKSDYSKLLINDDIYDYNRGTETYFRRSGTKGSTVTCEKWWFWFYTKVVESFKETQGKVN